MRIFASYQSQDQHKIDQISASVKKLLAISKKLKAMDEQWAKTYRSSMLELLEEPKQNSHHQKATFESIMAELKKWKDSMSAIDESIRKELIDYDCLSGLPSCPTTYFTAGMWSSGTVTRMDNSSLNLWINAQTKDQLIQQLNDICAELITIDPENRELKALIEVIRNQLHLYSHTLNEWHLVSAVEAYSTWRETSKEQRITYTHTLREHKKKLSIRQRRDLRQCYRRIIRFLFKNLEADDHDSAYGSQTTRIEQLFMIRQLNNENKSSAHRLFTTTGGRPGYTGKEEKRNTKKNQAIPG